MDTRTAQIIAIGAMLMALGLALVDTGRPAGAATGAAMSDTWTTAVEAGEDHVTPEALATLMLEKPEQLLIVDVRPPEEFAHFHLPGAVNLDLVALTGPRGAEVLDAASEKTVVLVSNGMTHPAQAWVALTQAGRANVRILEDGLRGFVDRMLTPPSLRGATTESRAKAETDQFQALRQHVLKRAGESAVAR